MFSEAELRCVGERQQHQEFAMFRKLTLALTAAAALSGAAAITTTPAAADPWGYHHGWHGGGGLGIGFGFAPPLYGPAPVYYDEAPRCYLKRHWERGYYGWHRVVRRVCY